MKLENNKVDFSLNGNDGRRWKKFSAVFKIEQRRWKGERKFGENNPSKDVMEDDDKEENEKKKLSERYTMQIHLITKWL